MPERKPPRMRAACGQCHSAKVKCSGDRKGCTRCVKLNLICRYGVSMVGRASKRKNGDNSETKNGSDSNEADDAPTLPMTFDYTNDMNPEFQLLPQDLLNVPGLDDFSFNAFPEHVHTESSLFDSIVEDNSPTWSKTGGSSSANASSMVGDEITPASAQECEAPQIDHSACDNHHNHLHARPPQPSSQVSDFPLEPRSLSNNQDKYGAATSAEPIFVLARLAMWLENNSKEELPLDKTLTLVKSSLRELMEQVNLGYTLLSITCRSLVFACVQCIVRLYARSLQRHRQQSPNDPQAQFKLGSFEIDPEDQLKLQNQALAAELGRSIREIKKLSSLWAKACDHGENCRGVHHYHTMEKEMQKMKQDIESESIKMMREELARATVHDKKLMHPLI